MPECAPLAEALPDALPDALDPPACDRLQNNAPETLVFNEIRMGTTRGPIAPYRHITNGMMPIQVIPFAGPLLAADRSRFAPPLFALAAIQASSNPR